LVLRRAKLAAFGSTRYKGVKTEEDANVRALVEAETEVVTLVCKAWDMQVEVVLETTLEENLAMIKDTVDYFKELGKEVMVDMEHFFDGFRLNPDYALATLDAARNADVFVLCDTNGGTLPQNISAAVTHVRSLFPNALGIHCHNDMDLAVANSIAAVGAGATVVQGTINGIGERTGNASLTSIIPILALKMNIPCLVENTHTDSPPAEPAAEGGAGSALPKIARGVPGMTALSRFVDEVINNPHVGSRAFVGNSAFAHKGGLHVAAVMKNADTYQHIDPGAVGNVRRVLVSELSGRGNILTKAREMGLYAAANSARTAAGELPLDDESAWKLRSKGILARVKALENQGYTFEGAEASVELMIRRSTPEYVAPFEVLDFTVITGHRKDQEADAAIPFEGSVSQATVKLELSGALCMVGDEHGVDGHCPRETHLEVAEGNGPVDALNGAMRKALFVSYPDLADVTLVDYKVRILDNDNATRAITRVMIEFAHARTQKRWTTVSAHANIIVASLNALVDGFEYAMFQSMEVNAQHARAAAEAAVGLRVEPVRAEAAI